MASRESGNGEPLDGQSDQVQKIEAHEQHINDPNNNVVLTSMHKYVPKIWIVCCFDAKNYNELFTHLTALFAFKETEFITVKAYQNENITKLKINNNPFANNFCEMGQSRFKRKHHSIDHQAQSDSSPDERVSLIYDSESNQPNDPPLRGVEVGWPCNVGEADANPATVASRFPAPGVLETQCPCTAFDTDGYPFTK
ncbi:T-box protein 2 [Temnothorax longispinosus]|uniref:T-box protein 2 n=1 Tax=Temnothorax longispinosus TaxID=300112 RepID=A0A4S2KW27_9HYME|nr:T-box protein 2 [Temnothorax longispinosus]